MRDHARFAIPMIVPASLPVVAAVVFGPLSWWTWLVIAGVFLTFAAADAMVRYRAARQIRRWAAAQGLREVQKCPRGGFPSWGATFWTFAEMDWYRGVRDDGVPRDILASTHAPAFGLCVRTVCELRERVKPLGQEHSLC